MVDDNRHSLLTMRRNGPAILLVFAAFLLDARGYLIDGIEWFLPKESSRDAVCSRENLEIALSAGPYPPFVFPVMQTAEGPVSPASTSISSGRSNENYRTTAARPSNRRSGLSHSLSSLP